MKQIFLLISFLCAAAPKCYCQKITGRIIPDEKWENKMYILKIEDYMKNTLVDSIELNSNGEFNYIFKNENLPREIYKIVMPLKGHNENYQTEGHNDNYFLYTTEDTSTSIIYAHSDSLYFSIKISNSKSNERLLFYRDLKRPFSNLSLAIDNAISKEPQLKDSINKVFLKKWMSEVYAYREKLAKTINTENEDYMLLAGLYYSYHANAGQLDSSFAQTVLKKIKINYSLASNTKKLINSAQNNRIQSVLVNNILKNTTLDKKEIYKINSTNNKYHVIYFWASWCKPCRVTNKKYLPEIIKTYKRCNFTSISIDEHQTNWLKANTEDNINWGSYWDYSSMVAMSLNINSVPLFIIINNQNEIIFETNNHYELEKEINELLAKEKN